MATPTVAPTNGASPDNAHGIAVDIFGTLATITVEWIGPTEAEQFLTRNTHNRNLKPANIDKMVADLRNGDFKFGTSTISFDWDGVLLDGQNRLHAIIKSGRTFPMIVVRGLDPAAQDDMDTGSKRSFGDVLKLRGETQCNQVAATTRRVAAWDDGARKNLVQWNGTHSALLRYLDRHPEIRDTVTPARRCAKATGMNASSLGLLMVVFDRIDAEDAQFFFDRLADGQGLVKGDPVFELRRSLANDSERGGNAQVVRHIVYTIKAWNAYRDGQTVGLLRWRPGGANPEQFPEPR